MGNEATEVTETTLRDGLRVSRAALEEITSPDSIGEPCGVELHEDGAQTQFFTCLLPGYPGWRWAAALAQVGDDPATVLEVELLAGPDAVVAPEWVPWSVRLAQFREAQARQAAEEAAAAEAAAAELGDEEELDAEEELLDNDFSDFDDEIDGVELEEEVEFDESALLAALDAKSAKKHGRPASSAAADDDEADDDAAADDADIDDDYDVDADFEDDEDVDADDVRNAEDSDEADEADEHSDLDAFDEDEEDEED